MIPLGKSAHIQPREPAKRTAYPFANEIKGYAGQRRKHTIQKGRSVEGRNGKRAEHFEDARKKNGVNRSEPSRRAGRLTKHATEAVPRRQRLGYIAGFIFERDSGESIPGNQRSLVEHKCDAACKCEKNDKRKSKRAGEVCVLARAK